MNNPCWLLGLVCDCFQGKNLKARTEAPMQMEGQATPSQGFNQLGKVEQVTSEDFNWASTNAKIRKPPFFWIPRLFWIGFKRLLTDDIIERAVPIQQKKWGADIWNNESIYIFTTTHVALNKSSQQGLIAPVGINPYFSVSNSWKSLRILSDFLQ